MPDLAVQSDVPETPTFLVDLEPTAQGLTTVATLKTPQAALRLKTTLQWPLVGWMTLGGIAGAGLAVMYQRAGDRREQARRSRARQRRGLRPSDP
jgi:hypothetical protein